ncbi:hypothetical protein MMC25_004800 [Agyrium rufum]|nr:hypothetical protein [Agyrium rufum]
MKLLTANFLTCAVKACKTQPASFPLHFRDAELEQVEMDFNPAFVRNIMPRLDWDALRMTAAELGFTNLPELKPEFATLPTIVPTTQDADSNEDDAEMTDATAGALDTFAAASLSLEEQDKLVHRLHEILLETNVTEGKMVCGNCGHEYQIKEGIANFLLPSHLV